VSDVAHGYLVHSLAMKKPFSIVHCVIHRFGQVNIINFEQWDEMVDNLEQSDETVGAIWRKNLEQVFLHPIYSFL
jgi:hypothetical protein